MLRRAAFLFAVLFAGCSVGPNYHRPPVPVPTAFGELPTTKPSSRPSTEAVDLAYWWQALHDDELDRLLHRAVASNLDLEAAVARLQSARTAEALFAGTALPSLNFSGVAGVGTGTSQARGGQIDGPLDAASEATGLRQITHALGVDTFFEADLFGNLRRTGEAVSADAVAAGEFRNQVIVTLLADVARQYVTVRTLQLRLDIADQTVATLRRSADLERERYTRGITNELDAALADRELATAQANIDPLRSQLLAGERAVAVLLGQEPDSLIAELDKKAPLPTPPAALATGLPGDLLRRRPDVRQAEAQLMAANARLGVAVANLYPKLFLSAAGGIEGQGLGREPVAWRGIWSVGPTVDYPLLDFGTADARRQQADQATREQVARYRQMILTAVQQVDDGLTEYEAQRSRLAALDHALTAAHRALDLATQRYDRGIIDYLNVLDAQRALFALEDQYAVTEQSAVTQFVGVCQNLGGGWQGFPPPPPLERPMPAVLATIRDATAAPPAPLDATR